MFIPTLLRRDRIYGACVVLSLAVGLPMSATAQDAARGRPTDTRGDGMPAEIKAAQAFILSAYPDLYGRPLEFTSRQDGDAAVLVSVADLSVARTPGQALPPLVTARVEYDTNASLRRFDAYGPLVEDARNLKLQEALMVNPRWIDSDADVWLMREGAPSTVGPVSPRVSPEATRTVEQQVGVTRSAAAKFVWHQEGTEAAAPAFRSRPAWVTEATMTGPDGVPVVYQFEYEPFAGRLISVTQRGGR